MAALSNLQFLSIESSEQIDRLRYAFAALLECMRERPSRSLAQETMYHRDLAANLAALGDALAVYGEPEAALKWTLFSEPDRADSYAQRLLSFTRDPTTANVATLLAQSASEPAFFDRMRRYVKEFARRILGPTGSIDLQAVCRYARSLRESLRPARTDLTRRDQNFYALVWLKVLWQELGLEEGGPNPSFHGPPEVRRALADLADIARELSANWGVQHGVMQSVGNPLEIPRPNHELVRDLAEVVDRLNVADATRSQSVESRASDQPPASNPPVEVTEWAGVMHDFLWKPAAESSQTKGFMAKHHDDLLRLLQNKLDEALGGKPRSIFLQSLQDSGCDLLIDWGNGHKYGIQLKSHFDIGEKDFAKNTFAQIQRSREHSLKRLYILLAGDMSDTSQGQKVRGFEANVSKQNDQYVVTVSPERLWTVLFE